MRDNVFVADFANKGDRDRAQEGTPWMVGRHAVILRDYDPRLRPSEIRFDSMAIWARIINLPFELMNNRKGLKIAKMIDKNCKVDVDEDGEASGTFLRARVAIPFAEPIRRWVTISRGGATEKFELQYEKLPFICFSCGLIGHSDLECPNPAERDSDGKLPFDRGLRAPEDRRRRMQSFSQAAASASWYSDPIDRGGGGGAKSFPGSAASRTSRESGEGENVKSGKQEVASPPPKVKLAQGASRVSEIAKKLFPAETERKGNGQKNDFDKPNTALAMVVAGTIGVEADKRLENLDRSIETLKKQKNENSHRKTSVGQEGESGEQFVTTLEAGLHVQPCKDQCKW